MSRKLLFKETRLELYTTLCHQTSEVMIKRATPPLPPDLRGHTWSSWAQASMTVISFPLLLPVNFSCQERGKKKTLMGNFHRAKGINQEGAFKTSSGGVSDSDFLPEALSLLVFHPPVYLFKSAGVYVQTPGPFCVILPPPCRKRSVVLIITWQTERRWHQQSTFHTRSEEGVLWRYSLT